jgi:zinc protease
MMSLRTVRHGDTTMVRRLASLSLALALGLAATSACDGGREGVRPENLTYEPLEFTPPSPADFRTELSNGLVVYLAEDHEIPWFDASLLVRDGPFLEPADKIGLASLTQRLMREGGTTSMTGEDLDERMDYLAGSVTATRLSIHMRHLDEGLGIWLDILNNPAFPADKLRRQKEAALVSIQNRNQNVTSVAGRTFNDLIYGEDSPITAQQTEAMVNGFSRQDLLGWHERYWGANNAILIVAGAFDREEMLQKLEETFGQWRTPRRPNRRSRGAAGGGSRRVHDRAGGHPEPGGDSHRPPGLDAGRPGLRCGGPHELHPGGRILLLPHHQGRPVRPGAGLLHRVRLLRRHALSRDFAASCQTKNSTVVFAAQLMLNEIERIRTEPVPAEDLEFARTARVNAFPAMFAGGGMGGGSGIFRTLSNFAGLEFNGRPMDYYDRYVERYEQVTVADVQRVAQEYLRPENMIIMVAGNISESRAGADDLLPNQATIDEMAALFGGRTVDGLAAKYGNGTVRILDLK